MSILSAPAVRAAGVTPSDSTIVNARMIYVGGAGNLAITPLEGSAAVTFTAVPAGTTLSVSASKIMSTNTTATAIVALY